MGTGSTNQFFVVLLLGCGIATISFNGLFSLRYSSADWSELAGIPLGVSSSPSETHRQTTATTQHYSILDDEDEEAFMRANITDPEHTPRLQRFRNTDNFPTPKFHGCSSELGLCSFENVCFSNRNHMLVMDVPGLRSSETKEGQPLRWFEPDSDYDKTIVPPRKPKLVARENYTQFRNVYFAESIFVTNCWCAHEKEYNPSHMLMGEGKVFVHATGHWDEDDGSWLRRRPSHETFDLILHHQCTTTREWGWGKMVSGLIWKEAVARGTVRPPRADATLYLPYQDGDDLLPDDAIVCGRTVKQAPYYPGAYFDGNFPLVAQRWQEVVQEMVETEPDIQKHIHEVVPAPAEPQDDTTTADAAESAPGAKNACTRNLRIAAWQRTEGTSLRLFRNMDDLRGLAAEYSDQEFAILTASAATPAEEQVAVFRSFDILITPHGSHLVNMIFSPRQSVYVEVSPVYYDMGPYINGVSFAKDWVHSFGHEPYNNPELAKKMPDCLNRDESPEGGCPKFPYRSEFVHSDMIINTTIFRQDLERAVHALCPSFTPRPATIVVESDATPA